MVTHSHSSANVVLVVARIAAVAVAALGNNQQGYQGQTDTLSSVSCRTPQRNARCECRKKTALAVVASCSAVSTALLLLLLLLPCPTNRSLSVPCFVSFFSTTRECPCCCWWWYWYCCGCLTLSSSLSLSLSLLFLSTTMLGLSVGEKKKEDTEGPFCWMIPFRVPSVCCVVLCVAAFVLCRLQGLRAD